MNTYAGREEGRKWANQSGLVARTEQGIPAAQV
jgi:hypothetical protein